MKQVEYFSLKLVTYDGDIPVDNEQGETYQLLGNNLESMGEKMLNVAASKGWDVFSLLDAGYAHSLLQLRQTQLPVLTNQMWLVLTLTDDT